jgi:hypothetical protein
VTATEILSLPAGATPRVTNPYPRPPRPAPGRDRANRDAAAIVARLLDTRATIGDLAAEYGCAPAVINLLYAELVPRPQRMAAANRKRLATIERQAVRRARAKARAAK